MSIESSDGFEAGVYKGLEGPDGATCPMTYEFQLQISAQLTLLLHYSASPDAIYKHIYVGNLVITRSYSLAIESCKV